MSVVDALRKVGASTLLSAAFLLCMPLANLSTSIKTYDIHRMMQIALLVACTVLAIFHPASRMALGDGLSRVPQWIKACLLAFLGLGLASSLSADLPRWSILEWSLVTQLGMLTLLVACTGSGNFNHGYHGFETAIIGTVLALSVLLAASYAGSAVTGAVNWREIHPAFENPRFLGQFMTMTIPIVVAAAARERRGRWAIWCLAALWWCWAIGNSSRGTALAVLVGAVAAFIFFGRHNGRYWAVFFSSLLAGFVLFGLLAWLIPWTLGADIRLETGRFVDSAALMNPWGRDVLWMEALKLAASHPWLGYGPAMFATRGALSAHPHNSVLQLMAEWGLPAVLLVSVVVIAVYKRVWDSRRQDPPSHATTAIRAGLLASLTGALVQSLFDGVLVVPTSQVLVAITAGWLLAASGPITMKPPVAGGGHGRRYEAHVGPLVTTAAVSAIALATFSSPEWSHPSRLIESYDARYSEGNYLDWLAPRFWMQGRLAPSPGQPYEPWQ